MTQFLAKPSKRATSIFVKKALLSQRNCEFQVGFFFVSWLKSSKQACVKLFKSIRFNLVQSLRLTDFSNRQKRGVVFWDHHSFCYIKVHFNAFYSCCYYKCPVLFFTQDTPSVVLAWKQATVQAIYSKYCKDSNESHTFTDWADWAVWAVLKISVILLKYPTFSHFYELKKGKIRVSAIKS